MHSVLVYGASDTCATLRHELPVAIGDPTLYLEHDGRRVVVTSSLEEDRIAAAAPQIEQVLVEELGWDELRSSGLPHEQAERELCLRAVRRLGISSALVPGEFPVALADFLRGAGVRLATDEKLFATRRRRKSEAELAGVRRASAVALRAMAEAARLLHEARIEGSTLSLGGEPLTSEAVRAGIRELCAREQAFAPAEIIVRAACASGAIGHDCGHGPLPAHEPIEVDLWPRDELSGCWSDMTRTFVRGSIGERVAEVHALVLAAHERACAAVRPGVTGAELHALASEVFEAAGQPTQRTKQPGETLREGFYYSLGHGVGLEVHERPAIGISGDEPLLAGDVIAIEPGTYLPGVGGIGVEDLLLVTESGAERLTGDYGYGLAP